MELTRRGLFKAAGAALATTAAFELTSKTKAFAGSASKQDWKLVDTQEATNICCYCAGGCGSLCSSRDGELINVEGDPDHPINEGALCPKGAAMFQLRNIVDPETREVIPNPARVSKPLVRRPGSDHWEDITWEQAIKEIAEKVKKTRDETHCETSEDAKKYFEDHGFYYPDAEKDADGNPLIVNITPGIASLGGSQENSEEEYLIMKLDRALGVCAIDNQARV
ncbi:MAG: molybdopterin-dependent oxidoreductase [Coriobacteriales bacterium]|nr:molybdopterin-dependent oxidoreductase [Coriobacteriales bacterium]